MTTSATIPSRPAEVPANGDALPNDVTLLRTMILDLVKKLQAKDLLVEKMQHQLEKFLRHRFGQRADRLDPNNPGLFTKEEIEAILAAVNPKPVEKEKIVYERAKPKKGGHGRQEIPADLPCVRTVIDVPEAEKTCGVCGSAKIMIREEISSQMEYRPASLYAKHTVRPVYACPRECEGQVVVAPLPETPISKCLAGPGLLAQIAVSKYGDHLPLNRQQDILSRHGVHISRQTQCDWMMNVGALVTPLYGVLKESVLASKVVATDDTTVKLQEEGNPKTRTARGWIYLDTIRRLAAFDFTLTRSRDGPLTFLGDYSGYLQADAYAGYDAFFTNGRAKEVACWAHARRYFVNAETTAPALSGAAVSWIRLLYDVEDEAKAFRNSLPREMSAEERRAQTTRRRWELRQAKSLPILSQFEAWLKRQALTALPKSPLGEAVSYTLANWEALKRYTEDGDLRIDNIRRPGRAGGSERSEPEGRFAGGESQHGGAGDAACGGGTEELAVRGERAGREDVGDPDEPDLLSEAAPAESVGVHEGRAGADRGHAGERSGTVPAGRVEAEPRRWREKSADGMTSGKTQEKDGGLVFADGAVPFSE